MTTNDNTSALLALPIELVGRIADSLKPESLVMLRLTCKVLEHSTYDLFAKTFFEQRYCCIYYEPRWLLIKDITSSRLGSRVREVMFTTDPLEHKLCEDLQLAPDKSDEDMEQAQNTVGLDLSTFIGPKRQLPAWPSTAVFQRIFLDFRRFAPRSLIKLDFTKYWELHTDLTTKTDVLVAVVSAGMPLDALKVDALDAHLLESVLTHLESQLMASIRSLKSFHYEKHNNEHDPRFVTAILESAHELRELVIGPDDDLPITTAVLQEHDFPRLTMLCVFGVIFPSEDFVAGLSACRSLLHLVLVDVRLSGAEGAWPSVFRALAGMLQLHDLSLRFMGDRVVSPSDFRFLIYRGLSHGETTLDGKGIEYEGREQTAAGLNELIATPVRGGDHHGTF